MKYEKGSMSCHGHDGWISEQQNEKFHHKMNQMNHALQSVTDNNNCKKVSMMCSTVVFWFRMLMHFLLKQEASLTVCWSAANSVWGVLYTFQIEINESTTWTFFQREQICSITRSCVFVVTLYVLSPGRPSPRAEECHREASDELIKCSTEKHMSR